VELSGHHHVDITEAVRRHVQDKADHLNHIFNGITNLHVAFDRAQNSFYVAEFVAHVSHAAPVVGKASAEMLDAAIELAAEKVEAQLRKHKEKVRDRKSRPPRTEAEPPAAPAEEESDSWESSPPTT
jgi:putative sigma-54 modulation protein